MIFGFQARGGTAPTLTTSAGYRRSALGGSPVADGFQRYYDHAEDGEGELGLPAAPAFRGQKLGKSRGARGTTTKKGHGHLQSRPSRGKRPNEGRGHNDGMGPMLASRPASRQVLSDLMDLNLALKYDKARKHGEARPQKERSHHHNNRSSTTRKVGRRNDGCVVATKSSSPRRFSAPFDRPENLTSMRHPTKSGHYQAEPSKAHASSPVPNVVSNDQFEGGAGHNHDVMEQCNRWNGDLRSAPLKGSAATTVATSPSGCFEAYPGEESPVGLTSPATTLASQVKAHKVAARTAYACSGSSDWRNVYGNTQQDAVGNGFSGPGFGGEDDLRVSLGDNEGRREERVSPPCHETSSQQSEKDQRMWSALKTSLLSGSEAHADPPHDNLRVGRTEERGTPNGVDRYVDKGGINGNDEARGYGFLTEARDMEQLDQERSAMDRTMRPHRIASARLLETTRNSSSPIKVKHPRTFSASATRPRTYQSELSSSVWTGSTGTLECTGVRAELVPRNGDGQSGFSEESVNLADHHAFPAEARNRQQDGGQQQARKVDSGRFQWVTNDEGVANFLQRPPSRQKEAFPTHLADTVPYPAFQVELPLADEEAKQHIDGIRKNAVEQARPSSRHKPPGQSLFLEVSETTRRQVPPVFSPSQGTVASGPEPFSGLPAGILSMDGVDVEETPNCKALGTLFSLDRRHDNPDRDGFSVLQVQGPCPFRIEVTNSFVQPHPPMVSVVLEATLAANRNGTGKTGKTCPPNPSCGFFGSMPCEAGGRPCTGKQRAPINTTPALAVPATSSPVQTRCDAAGKGTCAMSFRMLGGRSAGGVGVGVGVGVPSRGTINLVPSTSRHEEGATVSDVPSPPPRPGNSSSREPEREGKLCAPEGRAVSALGEGVVEEGIGRKAKAVTGGVPSTWRADTPGLRVNTGASGVHVSDWSLQSCDDADDGAFLDGPVSTLGESVGTQRTLLETTLGQDFLSLFAPSSGHENSVASGEK